LLQFSFLLFGSDSSAAKQNRQEKNSEDISSLHFLIFHNYPQNNTQIHKLEFAPALILLLASEFSAAKQNMHEKIHSNIEEKEKPISK
jgi:hypothetical protein